MSLPNEREMSFLREHFEGDELKKAVKRLENGEPLAYIIGEWYFYGMTFCLNESCLIPRPDTEHVTEKIIELLPQNGHFADLCSGSGCIALSVLANRKDATCLSVELSADACEMIAKNASLNDVTASEQGKPGKIEILCADIFELQLEKESFDIIASNPPYIETAVIPSLETVKYEPKAALDGGEDGLKFYRHIINNFAPALKENGMFVFEIGYDQAEKIKELANAGGFECEITRDYGGNDRVAVLKKNE